MYNTGLENEDQLKIVRNEVKTKYNTESAMWASFKSPGPDGGRGVGVLVLGPLAPRTGWIVSDSCGHILSASSRVKPGLPVLCFIACDTYIPSLEPTPFESLHADLSIPSPPTEKERKEKVYQKLKEIIETEQDKGVFVFASGQIISNIQPNEGEKSDETAFSEMGVVRMAVIRRTQNEGDIDSSNEAPPSTTSISSSSTSSIAISPHATHAPPPTDLPIIGTIAHDSDDALVTDQPFGDGPRPPDGTGMKVLSTEALTTNLTTSHSPTMIQIAVYGWPSETFVFTTRTDGQLGSGKKPRRNKSGRKKEENVITSQVQQLNISSPRNMLQSDLTQSSSSYNNLSIHSTLNNNNNHQLQHQHQHHHLQQQQFGGILDPTISLTSSSTSLSLPLNS